MIVQHLCSSLCLGRDNRHSTETMIVLPVCSTLCLGVRQAQHPDYDSATFVLLPLPGSRLECVVLVWLENSRPPNPGTSGSRVCHAQIHVLIHVLECVQCPNSCPESCPDSCPEPCPFMSDSCPIHVRFMSFHVLSCPFMSDSCPIHVLSCRHIKPRPNYPLETKADLLVLKPKTSQTPKQGKP